MWMLPAAAGGDGGCGLWCGGRSDAAAVTLQASDGQFVVVSGVKRLQRQ